MTRTMDYFNKRLIKLRLKHSEDEIEAIKKDIISKKNPFDITSIIFEASCALLMYWKASTALEQQAATRKFDSGDLMNLALAQISIAEPIPFSLVSISRAAFKQTLNPTPQLLALDLELFEGIEVRREKRTPKKPICLMKETTYMQTPAGPNFLSMPLPLSHETCKGEITK